jgi:hypothetical protein
LAFEKLKFGKRPTVTEIRRENTLKTMFEARFFNRETRVVFFQDSVDSSKSNPAIWCHTGQYGEVEFSVMGYGYVATGVIDVEIKHE